MRKRREREKKEKGETEKCYPCVNNGRPLHSLPILHTEGIESTLFGVFTEIFPPIFYILPIPSPFPFHFFDKGNYYREWRKKGDTREGGKKVGRKERKKERKQQSENKIKYPSN